MITKVEGFILSTVNYGESSLVIHLFTKEYGIIGLMAKGAKSMKNRLHALTLKFTYGFFYIYYKEGKLSILKEVDLIHPFPKIHNDIMLISYMTYLSDLTKQVYQESNEPLIYDQFIATLYKMEEGFDPAILTNILEVKYLTYLGVGLNLDGCIHCGTTTNIVTVADGGLICKDCYHGELLVDAKTIKLLRMYQYVEIKNISKLELPKKNVEEANQFLVQYYTRFTGIYLKSKDFLTKLNTL